MQLADSKRLLAADAEAINRGIPTIRLMKNASAKVAAAAMELAGKNRTCAVFCGSGNNGGDGIGAAAELCRNGFIVRTYLVSDSEKMSDAADEMAVELEEAGGIIEIFNPNVSDTVRFVMDCGVIIDAIFGIGLSREVTGLPLEAVKLINASPAKTVSVDIASGVEADTGRILGEAVRADVTVTFTMAKPGHFIMPGASARGRLTVTDIGIPKELAESAAGNISAITVSDLFIPERGMDTYKWDYGRVLIIAGSMGYTGAPIMASKAALKTGSGLIFLAVPDSIYNITAVKSDEVMVMPFPADEKGRFSKDSVDMIIEMLGTCDVCLLGCGLGLGENITRLVESIIRSCKVPLVLDADGINAIAGNIDILNEASCPIIITPHEREFARIGGDLSNGRLRGALEFADKYGCAVVLKGSGTITALPNGCAYVNITGNPGMAKGGSGDILAGMIASFIGQKFPPAQAAVYGVFLHGMAGDICKKQLTEYAMTPMDMLDYTSEAFKIISRK